MSASIRVKPGDILDGKYRVERVLGAGGMGVVVAARHVDLGQRVAIKFMLREAMNDPSAAERFLREAKSAVRLTSAHTARVLDVGRLRNGEPYMVMEYLEGHDLDAELRQNGPMQPEAAVDAILQVCEALAEAHGMGMIHRDVKLKNVFLAQTRGARPIVKVLDFGLAKTIGSHGDVSLTATNSVFGSPQYMSPEQMRSAKDVDARSDVWSIGVCLFELLTGRVPFDGQGIAEICAAVLKDPAPAPSTFARGLPADLEAAVLRCLTKDVNLRFQTVADLAVALEPWAIPGVAARVHHVMVAAQKVEHPTAVMDRWEPPTNDSTRAGTVSNWDSQIADKTIAAPRRTSAATIAALSAAGLMVVLLSIAGGMLYRMNRVRTAAALVDAASVPPPISTALTTAPSSLGGAPTAAPSPPAPAVDPTPNAAGGSGPTPTGTTATTSPQAPNAAPNGLNANPGARTARPSGPRPPHATPTPTPTPSPTGAPTPPPTAKPNRPSGMDEM